MLTSEVLVEAIEGPVEVIGVLLTADDQTIRQRLSFREVGSALEAHPHRSAGRAAQLEKNCPDWVHRVATDRKSVTEIAAELLDLTGWGR